MYHSKTRYDFVAEKLRIKKKISIEDIKKICSDKIPNGLSAQAYKQFFGTIYSIVFDLTDNIMYVCFGPPKLNKWEKINLSEVSIKEYAAEFINERVSKEFFEVVK